MDKVENTHKCPKQLWKKMTMREQHIYNSLREYKQNIIFPFGYLESEIWDVISHNFSYLAATL